MKFFEARGHRVLPSSSLVPANDPTLLFSNAGMNQFKDVFLGREKRDYSRATTSQKCVRAGGKHNDLEQVGRTTRHHTFFEMLGNFSFGDYFKKEAIPWSWELVTQGYGIPIDKLYVTVFREDDEAEEIWANDVGVARGRIFRMDEHDNFWAMGDTGPCGPCSEIHYDLGPAASSLGHTDCAFPCPQDCGRYVELWNLVFMQFNRDDQGVMTPLPRPSIDTGMGLERLASVLQGKLSNFDTDLFRPLIDEAAALANLEYGPNHDSDVSLRIIADHARATTFLISDGVLPSNEGRGYVLRLIMRRALYHGQTLGLNEPFLFKMSGHVVQMMKDAYPELLETERHVAKAVRAEEERYAHTTRIGLERLETVPVVVSSGEELTFHLAKRLHRPISTHAPYGYEGSGLWSTFEGRHNIHATDDERAAFEEFKVLWTRFRSDLTKKVFDDVSAYLPEGVSRHEWMDSFKVTLFQEFHALPPYASFKEALQKVRDRVKDNPLLCDALDFLMRRFPPRGIAAWIPGDELFKMHDTFGLRPEFINDLVSIYGFAVDQAGYDLEMGRQRERARATRKEQIREVSHGADAFIVVSNFRQLAEIHPTRFVGYEETTSTRCRVVGIFDREQSLGRMEPGTTRDLVLDHTPFYAEAGGQVGDTGQLLQPDTGREVALVTGTYSPVSNLTVHKVVARSILHVGDLVTAQVAVGRRDAIRRNHTATHLLHAALRLTLGPHVKQAGSLVELERLRFDFTHYAALDEQDLLDIENIVNERILKNEEVVTTVMDLESAVDSGAMALFGEKYRSQVRVLSIDDFSKELCGGTHVRRTGDIGLFKITSQSSVAAGTRRIEAVTGLNVLESLRHDEFFMNQVTGVLNTPFQPESMLRAISDLKDENKLLRKELEAQQMKRAASAAGDLAKEAREVKGVRVVAARVEVTDRAAMRQMVDDLRVKLRSGVIVLGSVADGKVTLIAAVTKDLTSKLDAGKIVKQAAAFVEGSGGGRKDLAEAGGKNPAKLEESLQAIPGIIESML